jgi:formylglycine-generating enzyme required for sulfatase activity
MQWRWYWCATTEEILKQNVNGIDVVFQADGRLIPHEQLAFTSYSYPKDNGGTGWCATFSTVIKDWKPGIYHFVIASTIKSVINDGEATFLPGFQISDFTVKIREPALKTEVVDDKGVPLALVQGSNFQMGGGAKVDQQPIHAVYLDSYYIDAYEVSNASYKACVDAGVCQPPNEISSTTHPSYYIDSKFDNYPVVNVNWSEAETYCKWRDARLPTEAEWEKTARGIGGRTYPWGNLLDCSFANYFDIGGTQCFVIGDTTPADKYVKGVSPFGVYGLVGNVSEWVSDWYSENYYSASAPYNPQGAESGKYRVIRGGSWKDDATSMLPTIRNWYNPESSSNTIGFRCAKDVTTVTPIETMPPGITPTFTATLTNTPEATASGVFVLISINNVAYRGGTASAKIQTQPGIECALAFFLPSGTKSDAGGLGPRTADANGYCSWTWDIAHNVSTGNGSVTIIVGGESKTYPIKIQ